MFLLLALVACGPPELSRGIAQSPTLADSGGPRFVVLGDVGKANGSQRAVARAIARVCTVRKCDFGILLGDNLYPRGMDSPRDEAIDEAITKIYGPLEMPFYAVLGNHDYAHGRDHQRAQWQLDWARQSDLVRMPAHLYQFDAGHVSFFALDTTRVFWYGESEQQQWLSEALKSSTAKHKIVLGHHPYRSNGKHGNAGNYEGWAGLPWLSGSALRRMFDATLENAPTWYLAGHDHNLQYLNYGCASLVVSGAGSTATPIVDRGNSTAFAADVSGFAWLDFTNEPRVAFYDENGRLLHEQTAHTGCDR